MNINCRIFTFFKGPEDLRSEIVFLAQLRRNCFGKNIFFGNFLSKYQKPILEYFSYRIDIFRSPIS
jgi:hypothetical protein